MSEMIQIAVDGQVYRTHSVDRVARRLYGSRARAVVQFRKDGRMYGMFVTPEPRNPNILRVRAGFTQPRPGAVDQKSLRHDHDDDDSQMLRAADIEAVEQPKADPQPEPKKRRSLYA